MKRVTEKVKDIVEVCPFTYLHDFAADPGLTLAGYHFTDITVDLMVKWIDRVASVKAGHGAALALAGFRGVGKSHFLAVLAAIVSRPELRARIADSHVVSSADRLSRRHGVVAVVRRGSGDSLHDEVKRAIAEILEVQPASLEDSLHDLLLRASEKAGELPLVILIDTALGRDSRVARDDGTLLSEIAEAAKSMGIFVGVALDDDISGADGANSSIAGSFSIDYLDQEHLYKIVDTHIFSKHSQMLPVLRDIYHNYRDVLPGFRWSEQRFSSLYPLHPATLEIAPLIRLYIHDFALLGFAAEAGVKILGRPANSLIGLDEVFDSVEIKLRASPDLLDVFSAFDTLERDVVAKTPVQFRLPAKLVLKGLLMLSLDGQGSTASEIAASMMIFSGEDSGTATIDVVQLLDSFAGALPTSIDRVERDGADPKYCFRLTAKEDANGVLAEAVKAIPDEIIWNVLLRQTAEKFSEIDVSEGPVGSSTECSIEWRGAIRRGEVVWSAADDAGAGPGGSESLDWSVVVDNGNIGGNVPVADAQSLTWKLAAPTNEERDAVRRYHLLQTDADVRAEFGDGLSTAVHVHSIAVEKIWQRVFLLDGVLVSGGTEYRFGEAMHATHSLTQLLSIALAPVFETEYPSHPEFPQLLTARQAASLIAGFFSGSGVSNADTQKLVEAFAFPLGLAAAHGDTPLPISGDALLELEIVRSALDGFSPDQEDTVIPLADISRRLQAAPIGLTREAQHLVLAALVAQRHFEFVTSNGNRINHRSLDLQIIWDDIVGLAVPLDKSLSPERLLAWAKLITGNSDIGSLDRTEDRLLTIDSLAAWLIEWKQSRILERFNALPDENLNAAIWKTAASLTKSYGAMAGSIEALICDEISLDQCLHSIGELFSDSNDEFERKKSDLTVLVEFISGVSRLNEIVRYLTLSEMTGDSEIEKAREALLACTNSGHFASSVLGNEHIEQCWITFRQLYASHYVESHDKIMKAAVAGQDLSEILGSDEWSLFESLSPVAWFDKRFGAKVKALIRQIRQLSCDAKLSDLIESTPFCSCRFSLADADRLGGLPNQLRRAVNDGVAGFRTRLIRDKEHILKGDATGSMRASTKAILDGLNDSDSFPPMTGEDLRLVRLAAERVFNDPPEKTTVNDKEMDDVDDPLPTAARAWEHDEVEPVGVFVKVDR